MFFVKIDLSSRAVRKRLPLSDWLKKGAGDREGRTRDLIFQLLISVFLLLFLFRPFFRSTAESLAAGLLFSPFPLRGYHALRRKKEKREEDEDFLRFVQELSARQAAGYSLQSSLILLCLRFREDRKNKADFSRRCEKAALLLQHKSPLQQALKELSSAFHSSSAKLFLRILGDQSLAQEELLQLLRQEEEILRSELHERAAADAESSRQRSESTLMGLMPFMILHFLSRTQSYFYHPAYENPVSRLLLFFSLLLALLSFALLKKWLLDELPVPSSGRKRSPSFFSSVFSAHHSEPQTEKDAPRGEKYFCLDIRNRIRAHSSFRFVFLPFHFVSVLFSVSKSTRNKRRHLYTEIVGRHPTSPEIYRDLWDENFCAKERKSSFRKKIRSHSLRASLSTLLRQIYPEQLRKEVLRCLNILSNDDERSREDHLREYFCRKSQLILLCLGLAVLLALFSVKSTLLILPALLLFPVLQDQDLFSRSKEARAELMESFPELIHLLTCFLNMHYSLENALESSLKLLGEEQKACRCLRDALNKERFGIALQSSLREHFELYRIPHVDRSIASLIHYLEDGEEESLRRLREDSRAAFQLFSLALRERLEKRYARLLLPMAISLCSILALSAAPLLAAFSGTF